MSAGFRQAGQSEYERSSTLQLIPVLASVAAVLLVTLSFDQTKFTLTALVLLGLAGLFASVFLLLPNRLLDYLFLTGLVLSIPFAHFAVIILAGEGVQWAHLFAGLLIVHMLVRCLRGARLVQVRPAAWAVAFLCTTIISALSIFHLPAEHTIEFWRSEVQLVFALLLYFAVVYARVKAVHIVAALRAMIVLSFGVALFGIYQLPARYFGWPGGFLTLSNISLAVGPQSGKLYNFMRAASLFSEPSYFGFYLTVMLAATLTAAMHKPTMLGKRAFLWATILVQTTALALCQSVGSFYLFCLLIVLMLIIERRGKRFALAFWVSVLGAAGAGILVWITVFTDLPVAQVLLARIEGIIRYFQGERTYLVAGESFYQRISTGQAALRVWADHPLIGVGLGSYTLVSYTYGEWNPMGFATNTLVGTLAETGILGFTALIGFCFASLHGLWRIFSKRKSAEPGHEDSETDAIRLAARMVFYMLAVQILYFHVASSLFLPTTWIYFGLASLVILKDREKARS